jgi:hypothetical protein
LVFRARRFPPLWTVEETACYVVSDRGEALAYRAADRLTKRDFKLAISRQEVGPVNLVARRSVRGVS